MARIRHIALTTKDPAKTAHFYKEAFGLKEVRRSPNGAVSGAREIAPNRFSPSRP